MRTPVIVVNCKVYAVALGPGAARLARLCELVAAETGASIAFAPPMPDLAAVARDAHLPILAQHVDNVSAGSRTGSVPPEAVAAAGAAGSLLNHSERRLRPGDLKALVPRMRDLGLLSVCCADTLSMARGLAAFEPDFVAVEPPELIGGDVAVTDAKPDIVRAAVAAVKERHPRVKVLCGAGVKKPRDVRAAVDLGTDGVLLASGVVLAKDPAKALRALASVL